MSIPKGRYAERKAAIKEIKELVSKPDHLLIIHYSCESFYKKIDGSSPRITSIAVRYFRDGQTKSFSIHQVAEEKHGKISKKIEKEYNALEKEMLKRFFNFLDAHREYHWIHWNMRDANYGFEAIEHRFRVLKGTPVILSHEKKHDLARLLVQKYSVGYIGHQRFEKLIEKNKISNKNFLTGKEESEAFESREYWKLHQSTLRKVDSLHSILGRTANDSLKHNARFFEMYGASIQDIVEMIKAHWIMSLLTVLSVLLGFAVKFVNFSTLF